MSHCISVVASAASASATTDAESRGGTSSSKARVRGIRLEMDGTLTVTAIDFQAMYKAVLGEDSYAEIRLKNPYRIDILHQIEGWSPDLK